MNFFFAVTDRCRRVGFRIVVICIILNIVFVDSAENGPGKVTSTCEPQHIEVHEEADVREL